MAEELFARVRRLVELAVAEGRRAVAEPAHGDGFSLRRTRFQVAAELTTTLTTEADRRARDAFGRLSDADPDAYAWAWLNTAVHLAATERTLIQSTWHSPAPAPLEVDGEHLLLALLDQPDGLIPRLFDQAGTDTQALHTALTQELARRPKVAGHGATPGQVYVTQRLGRLLDAAEQEAKRLKDEYVSVEHLVLALADEGSISAAGRLLKEGGFTKDAFPSALTGVRGNQRVTSATPESAYEALEKYGRDLVAEASEGTTDPVIGRDAEIRRVIQILSRKTKNNPVLIGDPGVGKTAIVEGLAQRIVRGDVPDGLRDRTIFSST